MIRRTFLKLLAASPLALITDHVSQDSGLEYVTCSFYEGKWHTSTYEFNGTQWQRTPDKDHYPRITV